MIKFEPKRISNYGILILCLAFLLFSNSSCKTTDQQSRTLERIIFNLTETSSTNQAVTWRTRCNVSSPKAQLAPATESPDFDKKALTVQAISQHV